MQNWIEASGIIEAVEYVMNLNESKIMKILEFNFGRVDLKWSGMKRYYNFLKKYVIYLHYEISLHFLWK